MPWSGRACWSSGQPLCITSGRLIPYSTRVEMKKTVVKRLTREHTHWFGRRSLRLGLWWGSSLALMVQGSAWRLGLMDPLRVKALLLLIYEPCSPSYKQPTLLVTRNINDRSKRRKTNVKNVHYSCHKLMWLVTREWNKLNQSCDLPPLLEPGLLLRLLTREVPVVILKLQVKYIRYRVKIVLRMRTEEKV